MSMEVVAVTVLVRLRWVQSAVEAITQGGVVPVELIPRHRAAVQLSVWPWAGELTGHEREMVLASFRAGPRHARYGEPFTPWPVGVCRRCGRTAHRPESPAGGPMEWVHDLSPSDLHPPEVAAQAAAGPPAGSGSQ